MSYLLAIDPGLHGALAVIKTDDPCLVAVDDMPVAGGEVNAHELARLIEVWKPQHAFIERVSSMPRDGVASAFKFGCGYGVVRTVVAMLHIPITLVTPSEWKRGMKLPGGPKGKEECRRRAIEMFPDNEKHFHRIKDHGRAEAALLALYGSLKSRT